ncbi:MAG: hypothetical protein KCHDKBKB_01411 [Elusimicrobia bacterium]|nr:hypothetical protein [Elusimicrobiota bacterium]
MGLFTSIIHAEATKEFTNDFGLYSGDPKGTIRMDLKSWGFSVNTFDGEYTGLADAPEGKKVVRMVLNSQWGGWGVANVDTNNPSIVISRDFSDYRNANGSLRFLLKSDKTLWVEIEHTAQQVVGRVPVGSTGNQWQEIVIPLSSFSGVDWTRIRFPFIIRVPDPPNGNSSTWHVDHIRWTKPVSTIELRPVGTSGATGQHRQFTAVGRTAGLEEVIIYPTWSVTGSGNTMNPSTRSRYSILTAGTANGTVTASDGVSGTASFTRLTTPAPTEFGLMSETISGAQLDVDSYLGLSTSGGGPVNITGPTAVTNDVREGTVAHAITVQSNPGGYAGFYIQWGVNGTPDTVVRDMSSYYDGSIRFWLKAPSQLSGILKVGFRSGNVSPGTEYSSVVLNGTNAVFNNNWNPVVIPLAQFAKAAPWADLSRVKVFFSMYVVGNTSGPRTFYIDNLRWSTNIPGPLATISVTPNPISVPLNGKRQFVAQGFDAAGVGVDIFPTWSVPLSVGTVSPVQGSRTLLTAGNSAAVGNITATQGISGSANVTVANITWTQSYNVYSDNGSGGSVGVYKGVHAGTNMTLSEQPGGVVGDPATFRRSLYTLVNNPGVQDAAAIWFTNTDGNNGSRFMRYFENGYLSFWVRTSKDLQVAIRSANIPAGTEQSKFRLSELGIPTDNTWQYVVIALSDFKARQPNLDFDQIQTYFAIGAVSAHIGEVTNQVFDVDDVKWLTNNPGAVDETKIYAGLKEKQVANGLVRSYNGLDNAVTYDQALVAMNYTYRKDTALAKKIFDVYKYIHDNYQNPNGPFSGFHDDYQVNSAVGSYSILNNNRTAGPNAWMLLALIHYRHATNLPTYDTVIDNLAAWLLGLQAADGSIRFGRFNANLLTYKSTEQNFDCYAGFKAYAQFRGNNAYNLAADNILSWLNSQMYIPSQQRFKVGILADGVTHNWDRALDAYSWAPLALSSFTNVLATADTDFKNTKTVDLTGISVTGFDFSGPVMNSVAPGAVADKDAVWLEGTAHMALAHYYAEDTVKGDFYMQELDKAIVTTSNNGQGMAYATNGGTAYGFNMDSLNPAASSSAWYLFAKRRFNPFQPFPLGSIELVNVGTQVRKSSMTWTVNVPARWVRADQALKLKAQGITSDAWGVQIFTDNTHPSLNPRFVDPTPGDNSNGDSNPAGLLREVQGQSTTPYRLNMAWSITDKGDLASAPGAENPNAGTPTSYQWHFLKDRQTPAIPSLNITAFADGQDEITLKKTSGSHLFQGPANYFPTSGPDYVYMQADFITAPAQTKFSTQVILEFFFQ